MQLRRLTTIDEFRQVMALEHEVWGYSSSEDAVPVPILIVSAKVGGLLIGAFDEAGRMVGFAYSLPGLASGMPFQWSHMLGVVESWRGKGVGWLLKVEQRRLTLEMGLGLIEWTFDPLQALNAHFNFVKLGALARHYHLDVYGDSSSPLHRGTATDRLIVEWWLRSPGVAQRLDAGDPSPGAGLRMNAPGAIGVNEVRASGAWLAPAGLRLQEDARTLAVTIPTGFTEMQQREVALARAWRAATREIFTTYLARGYVVTDFILDRASRRGTYLLTQPDRRSDEAVSAIAGGQRA